jgi:hypothetical protein
LTHQQKRQDKVIISIFSYLKVALISLAAVFLLGCETTSGFYQRQQTTYSIGSTDVFVTIPQEEIVLEQSARGGYIPIPPIPLFLPLVAVAVIVKAFSENKVDIPEDKIQPIQDSLVEVDVNQLIMESLQVKLTEIIWLNVKSVTHNSGADEKLRQDSFANSTAEAVLFVDVRYSLKSDYAALNAYADISLIPKTDTLQGYSVNPDAKKTKQYGRYKKYTAHKDNSIFRDQVFIREILPGTRRKNSKINAMYLKNNAEIVRERLIILAESLAGEILSSIQENGITSLDKAGGNMSNSRRRQW